MAHPGIQVIRDLLASGPPPSDDLLAKREALARLAGSMPAADGVAVEAVTLAERRAERLVPADAPDDELVLYLHGGSYCGGSPDTHRGLASALALASGRTVVTLDYRLAPEDPFPAGLNDALLAFDQLAPARVALAGDSAGGGLALATALALRDRGAAVPVAVALLSPWTDLTMTAASYDSRAEADPSLTRHALQVAADGYLDGADPTGPLASPLLGDHRGLPPLLVEVGDDEVLLDDSTDLVARARAAGVDATLRVWPEMIHVFQAFPPSMVPEAAESIANIGRFLAEHLARRDDTGG